MSQRAQFGSPARLANDADRRCVDSLAAPDPLPDPVDEWPREKLLRCGENRLHDAELIAIILGAGTRERSAIALAEQLLAHFGGLRELLEADHSELCALAGIGAARSAAIKACRALGFRYVMRPLNRGATIRSPADAHQLFAVELAGLKRESFACLYLDARNRAIRFELLFAGTIDGASVHPREIVRGIIRFNAAALISFSSLQGHNHPSGIAEPSAADRAITRNIQQAAQLLDVQLLDHVVVGDTDIVSFAERGWL